MYIENYEHKSSKAWTCTYTLLDLSLHSDMKNASAVIGKIMFSPKQLQQKGKTITLVINERNNGRHSHKTPLKCLVVLS